MHTVKCQTFPFQIIPFSMQKLFHFKQSSLNVKRVLFLAVQFRTSSQFSSIWPIERTLSGATTPGKSGPWSDGNERILRIPKSSNITEASPSDCLVSYPGHLLGRSLTPLQSSSRCINRRNKNNVKIVTKQVSWRP